jgi:hypothetical protein
MMQTRADFATPTASAPDDYEVNILLRPAALLPLVPLVDEQYRAGVTWLMQPSATSASPPRPARRPRRLPYDRKRSKSRWSYWRTGDRQYLVRQPVSTNWRDRPAR